MDVRNFIKSRGFKVGDVANAMGITRVTLSQSLANNPTIGTLQRVADVIGCKVGDFFADDMTHDAPSFFAVIKVGDSFRYTSDLNELDNIISEMKNEKKQVRA